jgi:glyoxylase-like metal-dependent hydrolase (beta-lactamase superfamily II)
MTRLGGAAAATVFLAALAGCNQETKPLQGKDGQTPVYVVEGRDGAPNAGVVCTRLGVVVVDPPLSPRMGRELRQIAEARSRNFWDELHRNLKQQPRTQAPPVLYVINTTHRATHSFGNQAFADKADFIATAQAARHLSDIEEVRAARAMLKSEFKVPELDDHALTPITMTVDGGTFALRLEDADVEFIPVGSCVGEGDAVVRLPRQKVLFAGDLVLVGQVPFAGAGRTQTVRAWIAALRKLEDLDLESVVPGHGKSGGKELLQQQREFLECLVKAVRAAADAGKTEDQAAREVSLPAPYKGWRNAQDWLAPNVRLIYRELTAPPEAPPPGVAPPASPAPGVSVPALPPPDVYRDK